MTDEARSLITIRLATEADVAFIKHSWLETYRRESRWAKAMDSNIFFPNHRRLLSDLLARCHTVVAANAEDPTHIVGFACGERLDGVLVMHFVYVPYKFRGRGFAKALLQAFDWVEGEPIVASHLTFAVTTDALRRFRVVFNPYLLFATHRQEISRAAKDSSRSVPQ